MPGVHLSLEWDAFYSQVPQLSVNLKNSLEYSKGMIYLHTGGDENDSFKNSNNLR
jgi:hypothetical protein